MTISSGLRLAATGLLAVLVLGGSTGANGGDPTSDIDELHTVATGDALAQIQYILLQYRKDGWVQVGTAAPEFGPVVARDHHGRPLCTRIDMTRIRGLGRRRVCQQLVVLTS